MTGRQFKKLVGDRLTRVRYGFTVAFGGYPIPDEIRFSYSTADLEKVLAPVKGQLPSHTLSAWRELFPTAPPHPHAILAPGSTLELIVDRD